MRSYSSIPWRIGYVLSHDVVYIACAIISIIFVLTKEKSLNKLDEYFEIDFVRTNKRIDQ
jgi:hypothetical protein